MGNEEISDQNHYITDDHRSNSYFRFTLVGGYLDIKGIEQNKNMLITRVSENYLRSVIIKKIRNRGAGAREQA